MVLARAEFESTERARSTGLIRSFAGESRPSNANWGIAREFDNLDDSVQVKLAASTAVKQILQVTSEFAQSTLPVSQIGDEAVLRPRYMRVNEPYLFRS